MGSPLQRKQYKPADKNPFGARGPAGTEFRLSLERDERRREALVRSADRTAYLKKPQLH